MLRQQKNLKTSNSLLIQRIQQQKPQIHALDTKDQALQFMITHYLQIKELQNPQTKLIKVELQQILQFYSQFYMLNYFDENAEETRTHLFSIFKKPIQKKMTKKYNKEALISDLIAYTYNVSCKNNISAEIKQIEQKILKTIEQQKAADHQKGTLSKQSTEDNTTSNNTANRNKIMSQEIQHMDIVNTNNENWFNTHQQNNPQRRVQGEPMDIDEIRHGQQLDLINIDAVFPQT